MNPLLSSYILPPYSQIKVEHVSTAIDHVLSNARTQIDAIANNDKNSVHHFIAHLEEISTKIDLAFAPVSHLNAVCHSDELSKAYEACLPKLSDFWTAIYQNHKLFKMCKNFAQSNNLDTTQKTIINNMLRSFRLNGIDLPINQQQEFTEINRKLSTLESTFANNVLNATSAWSLHIIDERELSGVSALAKEQFAQNAKNKGLDGYVLDLSFPNYYAIITYADNRSLREQIYYAYVTRASTLSDNGKFDNSAVMTQILKLRTQKAKLLGFNNYAELSIERKMAKNINEVRQFLINLADKSREFAKQELQELKDFAAKNGVLDLQSHDVAYFSEKLREQKFTLNEEQVRQYFPIEQVLQGMFLIAEKLYGISFKEVPSFDKPHIDARLFEIYEQNKLIGRFIVDLYARQNKRSGAWMDGITDRVQNLQDVQILPAANLVTNFMPASGDKPALLTHDDVITLFHEFGHGLHHLLTEINYASVSGINGVAWDAVELPSQFFENWCWQAQSLELIGKHYQTEENLPKEMLKQMLDAKNFQAALSMLRQIEFALFDLEIHATSDAKLNIYQVLNKVRAQVAVIIPPQFNRFAHSFSHIFAGGYAAGYYSYKWAEVLASDAFTRFEQQGVFNAQVGRQFRKAILAQGGSRDALELFKQFMGREPQIKALLKSSGLI